MALSVNDHSKVDDYIREQNDDKIQIIKEDTINELE